MVDDPGIEPPERRRRRPRRSDGETGGDPVGGTGEPRLSRRAAAREVMAATDAVSDADVEVHGARLPMFGGRSADPTVCPFLRAAEIGPDGRERIVAPVGVPDPANRCAALADAVPQSLRQQELVCLTSSHSNCPRYLRGAVVISEPVAAASGGGGIGMSPAILGSIAILVAAFAASIAFVTAQGGLAIEPFASTSPSPTTIAQVSPEPSAGSSIVVTPAPTAAPSDAPTAAPTVAPTAAPTAVPTATPAATAAGTSDRYALLKACPDAPDCWIYTIRSGDNLSSIANYFGHTLDTVYARNPWTKTTPLRAGQELRLPPPTR